MPALVPPDTIRAAFSASLSGMYRDEVPLYGDLLAIVDCVNADVLAASAERRTGVLPSDLGRIGAERHGAIRVGTAQELSALRRVFAVMGMVPVGYYDLAPAGVPVHSTAFRPIDEAALQTSPFRIFTSLLRLDLIRDDDLRERATRILCSRQILSSRALQLVSEAEAAGGLASDQVECFIAEVLETFRWHATGIVDAETYRQLNAAHRLIADVVSFRGPHINHLTPRTLDIDAAQQAMSAQGIGAKEVIEGPPPRAVPILLRQTSFKALEEPILFPGAAGGEAGSHTARFGEIEQRGAALTPQGRRLYDDLITQAKSAGAEYRTELVRAFARFPDTLDDLRQQGLAFFRYALTAEGLAAAQAGLPAPDRVDGFIARAWASAEPLTYEDFLPVSAAGIFQSNLGGGEVSGDGTVGGSQAEFEQALGVAVLDPFALYEAVEAESRARLVRDYTAARPAPEGGGISCRDV